MPQAVALIRTVKGRLPEDPQEFWDTYADIRAVINIVAYEIAAQVSRVFSADGGTV